MSNSHEVTPRRRRPFQARQSWLGPWSTLAPSRHWPMSTTSASAWTETHLTKALVRLLSLGGAGNSISTGLQGTAGSRNGATSRPLLKSLLTSRMGARTRPSPSLAASKASVDNRWRVEGGNQSVVLAAHEQVRSEFGPALRKVYRTASCGNGLFQTSKRGRMVHQPPWLSPWARGKKIEEEGRGEGCMVCLLYTSPSPRD